MVCRRRPGFVSLRRSWKMLAVAASIVMLRAPAFPAADRARGGVQLAVRAQVERLAPRHRMTVVAPFRIYPPIGRYRLKLREVPQRAAGRDRARSAVGRASSARATITCRSWPWTDPLGVELGLRSALDRAGRPDLLHGHWLHPHGTAAAAVGKRPGPGGLDCARARRVPARRSRRGAPRPVPRHGARGVCARGGGDLRQPGDGSSASGDPRSRLRSPARDPERSRCRALPAGCARGCARDAPPRDRRFTGARRRSPADRVRGRPPTGQAGRPAPARARADCAPAFRRWRWRSSATARKRRP